MQQERKEEQVLERIEVTHQETKKIKIMPPILISFHILCPTIYNIAPP
jgi:hypothetical protein